MKLPAHYRDPSGQNDYTEAGLADADLASAGIALHAVLQRRDLTPVQRKDFGSALAAVRRAGEIVGCHVDVDGFGKAND